MASRRTAIIAIPVILVAIIVCVVATKAFIDATRAVPESRTTCTDRDGMYDLSTNREVFWSCIDAQAKRFLLGDYAESKDLAKAFLTLLTAVFVGSITFSEKIVNLNEAGWWPRGVMIGAWSSFLVAIVTCGCGLVFITLGAGIATYEPDMNFWVFEQRAIAMFVSAGVAFGGGLAALLAAGVLSIIDRHIRHDVGHAS